MSAKQSIESVCKNPDCHTIMIVANAKIGRKKYCSRECMHAVRAKTSIWDTRIKEVQGKILTLGIAKMAEMFGVNEDRLKSLMSKWRKAGIKIPYLSKVAIGTFRIKKHRGQEHENIMTATGWKRLNPKKVKGVRKERARQVSEVKAPVVKIQKPKSEKVTDEPVVVRVVTRRKRSKGADKVHKIPQPEFKARDIIPYNPTTHKRVEIKKGLWKEVLR